ncbi:rhodanese-like domain-containing protein [Limosilactobacillus sp.]|uniref:rhodanese-like domain-containing protein n=1 Tax=Limosilactobacillus sp. TaxID=2773925 RepID=UPI0025C292A3|nr:rhodanese-like domain-containing protein [Limosilactobacillus sp.]MCH3923065.1 rhodanese-like domain-containing protein [Limosilactobacillus sp.]MCH3927748.1 rhodanese-like domain-containing protein [Limosilactobacillus sp.]
MILGVSRGLLIFNAVVIILLLVWFAVWGIQTLRRKRYATVLDSIDFHAGMRKAQVIDLRQENEFRAGHILGARNLPYIYLRQQYNELRPDLPVYMYDQGMAISTQAAAFLGKHGYHKLYILKGGYQDWDGKTKKSKY